jgi:hypothetical protein
MHYCATKQQFCNTAQRSHTLILLAKDPCPKSHKSFSPLLNPFISTHFNVSLPLLQVLKSGFLPSSFLPEMPYRFLIPDMRAARPKLLIIAPNNTTCELQIRSLLSTQVFSFYSRNSTKLLSVVL